MALDFWATIVERSSLTDCGSLAAPTLVMRGEHAPLPTRRIAEMLARAIPGATAEAVAGAGHMAPVTHPDAVAAALGRHLCGIKEQPADQRRSA